MNEMKSAVGPKMKVRAMERAGDALRLIDQTLLPGRLVYNDYKRYEDVIAAIKRLEVRGAPAIGISAAYALCLAAEHHITDANLNVPSLAAVAETIRQARPTAVNLAWAIDRMMQHLQFARPTSAAEIRQTLWAEAEAIHDEDRQMCARIGECGASLIESGDTILTHCNTGALATGGIGTALGVIYTCRDQGKEIKVFADETRPLLQGARLTAWELKEEGIDVTLNCDNMAGMLMAQGKVDHVIVGADRIAANGDTANKIGTYSLALLAVAHDVPFYVAAPSTTFDDQIESGDDIPIEERDASEVTSVLGTPIAPDAIKAYSPAFDVTPNELITCFITDTGLKPGGRSRS